MKRKKARKQQKRRSNPAGNFIEQLQNCSTIKVKFMGDYHKIPPTITNQAKKFALESVGVDYDVFSTSNPLPSAKFAEQIRQAFETFLEGYLESIMPLANPSSPRSEEVFKHLGKYFDVNDKNTLQKWFPNSEDQITAKRVMKSGVMKLVHTYLNGEVKLKVKESANVGKLDKAINEMVKAGEKTPEAAAAERQALIRSDFVMRPGSTDTQDQKVMFARTVRNIVALWTSQLATKILEVNGDELQKAVANKISGMTFAELVGHDLRNGLLTEVSNKLDQQLGNLDLIKTLK